jgi:hypothetical protein
VKGARRSGEAGSGGDWPQRGRDVRMLLGLFGSTALLTATRLIANPPCPCTRRRTHRCPQRAARSAGSPSRARPTPRRGSSRRRPRALRRLRRTARRPTSSPKLRTTPRLRRPALRRRLQGLIRLPHARLSEVEPAAARPARSARSKPAGRGARDATAPGGTTHLPLYRRRGSLPTEAMAAWMASRRQRSRLSSSKTTCSASGALNGNWAVAMGQAR